mmetsp:Transcript_20696/g.28781  ORF Transcript_20696/g.28781 Transcript_20696/m.28781 type:complete len:84 (-) Transcript_20696:1581-1832(-)
MFSIPQSRVMTRLFPPCSKKKKRRTTPARTEPTMEAPPTLLELFYVTRPCQEWTPRIYKIASSKFLFISVSNNLLLNIVCMDL